MTNEQRLEKLAARMAQQEETIAQLKEMLEKLTSNAGYGNSQINTYSDEEDMDQVYPNTREGVKREIMDNFDFEKVAEVCQHMNWEIYGEEDGVTVDFLKRDAEEKIQAAWDAFDSGEAKEEWIVHSGPLKLWWCECEDGIFAELTFVAEEFRVEPA